MAVPWCLSLLLIALQAVIPMALSTGADFTSTDLKDVVTNLATQIEMQLFNMGEEVRSSGGSGIKQIRTDLVGNKPYSSQTHTGERVAGLHDHADQQGTMGFGENIFVMNGVEFRTRHSDFPLKMPHRESTGYNDVEDIPLPGVPPEVENAGSVDQQIEEMRKWFEAWADQDHSERDYRPYFKPVLCYIEGGWTTAVDQLEGAYPGDQYFDQTVSWSELINRVQYNAHMGREVLRENEAILPRMIVNVTEDGRPVYVQWNYRILCHPLENDLPLSFFVPEDDVQARYVYDTTWDELKDTPAARFILQSDEDGRHSQLVHLDKLMMEIPGRNNYQGNLKEDTLGELYTHPDGSGEELNVARFHRRYAISELDASGLTKGKRGFSDPSMFVSETTHEEIAAMYVHHCHKGVCYEAKKRMTYALPLEIVYTTPLDNWNPHGIASLDDALSPSATENGKRNGNCSPEEAFQAFGKNLYYHTPKAFYSDSDGDLTESHVCMLGSDGGIHKVMASGTRVFLPNIPGVGSLRQRWPIMPVHAEGGSVRKELNSLRDIVMRLHDNEKYLYEPLPNEPEPVPKKLAYLVLAMPAASDGHVHLVNITAAQRKTVMYTSPIQVTSELAAGHTHDLRMDFNSGLFFFDQIDHHAVPEGEDNRLKWRIIGYNDNTQKVRG